MTEENFKKVLYLIVKVCIESNGFVSQLEIFRDVRNYMQNMFNLKESDLLIKYSQGRTEDFKDYLNFVLTILSELNLVSQKMENKSFFFKWNGMRGFRKKYLLDLINLEPYFEISESFEHRIQIYTRKMLLILHENKEKGITYKNCYEIAQECELDNQFKTLEKIHLILKYLDFITEKREGNQIFTTNDVPNSTFYLNWEFFDINIIKDNNVAEAFYQNFIENFLNKITYWSVLIQIHKEKDDENDHEMKTIKSENFSSSNHNNIAINFNTNIKQEDDEMIPMISENDLDDFKTNLSSLNADLDKSGFALLRGSNWIFYIKKLYCIIGRAPIKNGLSGDGTEGNTSWLVDVDLGQNKKISKQHAIIIYNFETCSFEIRNISRKFPIKVNSEIINFNEEMPLSSKSIISIGNQEFYFFLPV